MNAANNIRQSWHPLRRLLPVVLILLLNQPYSYSQVQVYPVSVTTQITPPYSVDLPDYASPGSEQLKVIILQRDLTQAPYSLYLKMEIGLNGRTIIRSSPNYIPPAFILEPGIPTLISGSSLAPYFDPANLEFIGFSREQYTRTRTLPEGAYNITFTAYDWTRREVALSRGGSFFCYLARSEPPLLNLPFNNSNVSDRTPQYINFQWLSRTASSPNSSWSTRYRLELFEVRIGGLSPSEIASGTRPIFTAETDRTNLVYSISEPALEKGMRYVWRVRAFDTGGKDYIRNDGYSEVFSFVYGEEGSAGFNAPGNFTARAVSSRKASLSWDVSSRYTSYKVYYRKNGSGSRWYEKETIQDNAEVVGLTPGETYECKVQGKTGSSWGEFSETDTVKMPGLPVIECGSPFIPLEISNHEPLLELMRLQQFDAGGFIVTLIDPYAITISPGRFSGKGYVEVPLFGHKKIRCEFNDIFINSDYQLVEGSIRLLTDNNDGQNALWDLDEVFEGGTDNGTVLEGTEEISLLIPDMVIPDAASLMLDTATHEILVIDESSDTLRFDVESKLADNPGTLTVQDAEGNLYSVDTKTGQSTSIGKVAPTGSMPQQITSLPSVVNTKIGRVTFQKALQTRFAFDQRDKAYAKSNLFNIEYKTMEADDGSLYEIPYKLIPVGETDVVLAKADIKVKSGRITFKSGTGTFYNADSLGKGEYLLTLPSGKQGDGIDVYATYTDAKGKTSVLGKMIVMSYSFKRPELTLVPVDGNGSDIDPVEVKQELDKVYLPVAVDWQVKMDNVDFKPEAVNLNITGSGLFSMYTEGMKKLNNDFILHKKSEFNPSTVYLFLLSKSEDGNATGDMPRGKQFGYVFTSTAGKGIYRTIAHEIAHGVFSLSHTFDKKYDIAEKSTTNLMDYTAGTDLVKHQWDAIHDPGLVIGMFERDEEGMMKNCFAPKPSLPGMMEGQREVVKFKSTTAGLVSMSQECTEVYYYHFEDEPYYSCCDENGEEILVQPEYKTDWYTEKQYCEKVIKPILESFGILSGNITVLSTNLESRQISAGYNLEQFFIDRSISDDILNTLKTSYYLDICKEATNKLSGSGKVDPVNIEFDIVLAFTGVGEARALLNYLKAKTFAQNIKLFASRTSKGVEILAGEGGEKVALYADNALKDIKYIDEGGQIVGTTGKIKILEQDGNTVESILQIVRKDGQIGFRKIVNSIKVFTKEQVDEYVNLATKQNDNLKVMLGKFDNGASTGYVSRAGKDHTYFDLSSKWDEAEAFVDRNAEEMWKINQRFIDNQKALGKEFYLSHDPQFATGYYLREINYLTMPIDKGGLGGKIMNQGNNLWKIIW